MGTEKPPINGLMISIAALFGLGIICATVLAITQVESSTTITVIGGMVLTAAGFLLTHFKQQVVEEKLQENTQLTKQGQATAATVANNAAFKAAAVAKDAVASVVDQVAATSEAVSEIKTAINGRMEELLNAARAAAFADGVAKGRAESADMREMVRQIQAAMQPATRK